MKNKKMPKLLLVFSILIIAFQHNYCSAQIQTIASTKGIEFCNLDITLNGKVKSIMIITHKPDYSCDTIKTIIDKSNNSNIQSFEFGIVKCSSDTIIYAFDQNLLLLEIIKIESYVNQFNYRTFDKIKYKFEKGLLTSEISTSDSDPLKIISYSYDSNNNLIFETLNSKKSKGRIIYKYDNKNNLIKMKGYTWNRYPNLWYKHSFKEVYEYDTLGHLIKKEKGKDGVDLFKYDSLGNQIEVGYSYLTKRKNYHYLPTKVFVYDTINRIVQYFDFYFSTSLYSKICNKYDENGNIINVKQYQFLEDTVLKYHLNLDYNEKGELIKVESQIESGTLFSPKYDNCKKQMIYYDDYGNIIQIRLFECKRYDENSERHEYYEKIFLYVYTYDSYGNWIKREEFEGESEDTLERIQIEDRIIEYY